MFCLQIYNKSKMLSSCLSESDNLGQIDHFSGITKYGHWYHLKGLNLKITVANTE